MVEISTLKKSFGVRSILKNINLKIDSGEILSIVGSSGSGKTTLLRLISGLEIPDNGRIVLSNQTVNDTNVFVPPENRNCSLVFQDYALFPNLTMKKNIYFGKNSSKNQNRIQELIDITNISLIMEKYPHECSGGEQQRVALVRSMAINPKLILMDEPMSNLDYNLKASLSEVVHKLLKKFKTTAIIVTHDISDAMNISDKIAVIDNGTIIQIDTPNEIYNNPNSKKVAGLFGETNFIPSTMLPESKHFFMDTDTNEKLTSVRPNQFYICKEDLKDGKTIFDGKIVSIKQIASEFRIELKCERITLNLLLKNTKDFHCGQQIQVMIF